MQPDQLLSLIDFWPTRVLLTAAELGLFARVTTPCTAAEVATALATDPRATRMLLDALVALEVLHLDHDRYAIPPGLTEALGDGADSVLPALLHRAGLWRSWSRLTQVVREGKPAVDPYENDQRADHDVRAFIGAMEVSARRAAPQAIATLYLDQVHTVLDVGGGPGSYAAAFCAAAPQARVVILDLPRVCELARTRLAGSDFANRIGFVAGEARTADDTAVLTATGGLGFDLVFASSLIHSMDPEQVRTLIGRLVGWTTPGGRIVIREFFVDDTRTAPRGAALFAVNMLVNTPGGRTYSWSEIEAWLTEAAPGGVATRIEAPDRRSGMLDYQLPAAPTG